MTHYLYTSASPRERLKRRSFQQADEYRRALSTFGEYGEQSLHERQHNEFDRWLAHEQFAHNGDRHWPTWHNDFLHVGLTHWSVTSDTYRWLSDEGERNYD